MFKQSEQNFDTHSKHFPKMKDKLLPVVDRAMAALLDDLEGRGRLDSTLVAWTGEFGQAPESRAGRSSPKARKTVGFQPTMRFT